MRTLRRARTRYAAAALVALTLAAGCGKAANKPTAHTLTVSVFDLYGLEITGEAELTVMNQSGTIIASDPTGVGSTTSDRRTVKFTVPTETFYTITMAGISVTYSYAQIVHLKWAAFVNLSEAQTP